MRFDVSNFKALKTAVEVFDNADDDEVLVLVFYDSSRQAYRFVISDHGVARTDCDKTGAPL